VNVAARAAFPREGEACPGGGALQQWGGSDCQAACALLWPAAMKVPPFLRALAAGAGAALVLTLVFAAYRTWHRAPEPPKPAGRPKLDVPYVVTLGEVVARMLDLAAVRAGDHVIDLGCGDGRILIAAARGRGATGYGVDIDPARIREAQANARAAGVGERVRFEVRDLFATPIRDATVVALYLLPEINLRLRPRLLAELRPGTRVLSHDFDMGDWPPDARDDGGGTPVYLWIVPARVAGRWTLTGAPGRVATITFEQRYQRVSGTFLAPGMAAPAPFEGRLDGDRIRFSAAGRHWDGRVAGDRIEPLDGGQWRMERAR
jgi:SAM-dependent methyltransferase